MAKKKPRNRAAQDATLLNLRALKKRVAALEILEGYHDRFEANVNRRITALEQYAKRPK